MPCSTPTAVSIYIRHPAALPLKDRIYITHPAGHRRMYMYLHHTMVPAEDHCSMYRHRNIPCRLTAEVYIYIRPCSYTAAVCRYITHPLCTAPQYVSTPHTLQAHFHRIHDIYITHPAGYHRSMESQQFSSPCSTVVPGVCILLSYLKQVM